MGNVLKLDTIEHAIDEVRAGRPVIVVDDEDRENEGDLIFAASKATPELLAFLIRYSSGVVCVPMEGAELDRLGIPLMTPHNRERMRTAYTISVDARDGISTGISAADRARTIRVLTDSASESYDLVQPGHVVPLRGREGGVLVRPGHTEASIDLARMAGLTPAAVISELVNDDGTMKRGPQLRAFADEHDLVLVSIDDLIRYRRLTESQIQRVATTTLPTQYGDFVAHGYRNTVDGSEQLALVRGEIALSRRVARAQASFVHDPAPKRRPHRGHDPAGHDTSSVAGRRRGRGQGERGDGLQVPAQAHPGRQPGVAKEDAGRATGEQLAVGQLELIQEGVARTALAIAQGDADEAVVPVEKTIQKSGIAGPDTGVQLDEPLGADGPGHAKPEPEDFAVEIVPRARLGVVLDDAGVVERQTA